MVIGYKKIQVLVPIEIPKGNAMADRFAQVLTAIAKGPRSIVQP